MDNFAECVVCKQGVLSFDMLDWTDICSDKRCQYTKRIIIDRVSGACDSCGYEFVKNTETQILCPRCHNAELEKEHVIKQTTILLTNSEDENESDRLPSE